LGEPGETDLRALCEAGPAAPAFGILGMPAVRDRVVPAALRNVLEPIFERDFAESSHGFRTGRGCQGAVARVEELFADGAVWVVAAGLKG
jgi:RNA-directed DNA polymerase